jgi:hypothetical protein
MDDRLDLSNDNLGAQFKADLIFSLADGFVWASWAGSVPKVRLGEYEAVTAMMRDFLAQSELGERLANGKPTN